MALPAMERTALRTPVLGYENFRIILMLVPQLSAIMFRGTSPSMAREIYEWRKA
jgi:hypothetical protein